MTDTNDAVPVMPKPEGNGTVEERPASISRRMLLRGASVAAPAILTLNSNTAVGWAIASGTIATRAPTTSTASAFCLDKTTVGNQVKPGVYLLDGYPDIVSVPNSMLYRKRGDNWTGSPTNINPEQVCAGGYLERNSSGTWVKFNSYVNTNQFAVLSSTAVASFGTNLVTRSVTEL